MFVIENCLLKLRISKKSDIEITALRLSVALLKNIRAQAVSLMSTIAPTFVLKGYGD